MSETPKSAAQPQSPEAPPSSPPAGAACAGLTEKQKAAYDLKCEGKTIAEIAAIRGISKPVVSKTLQACYRKLGLSKAKRPRPNVETRNPDLAAAAIEAAADPWFDKRTEAIKAANQRLREAGIPDKLSEALVRRMRVKYAGAVYAARELRTAEITEMLGKKIDLCSFYLDDKVLAEASARDIMLGMTALIEKRQLLRGEPTAIISDAERKKLHELLPLVIDEARRRGLTVDGQVTAKTVEPA